MRLFLAPMEGVVDHHLRHRLTELGGLDICVTEFVRVTDTRLPTKVFKKFCPELDSACHTRAGVPVRVQLLGSKPEAMAYNGAKVAGLGATAVDLNFGCPAKTVNSSDGGACLLQTPNRVFDIVRAVRAAVPASVPVTAKIRLGYADRSLYMENALAACAGGASELVVHARSKADGYRPPAYWDYIGRIRARLSIPVIANGEIWSVDDYRRCRAETGCSDFMLGRGLLARPDLALQIKAEQAGADYAPMTWTEVCTLLYQYHQDTKDAYPRRFLGNRVKQWLSYLQRNYSGAAQLFEEIKRLKDEAAMDTAFARHLPAGLVGTATALAATGD
jgi:tRNA-dihydrouridine synthase C